MTSHGPARVAFGESPWDFAYDSLTHLLFPRVWKLLEKARPPTPSRLWSSLSSPNKFREVPAFFTALNPQRDLRGTRDLAAKTRSILQGLRRFLFLFL